MNEVYYGLAVVASHLHLMVRDINESHRFCPNENRAQHQNIGQYDYSILFYSNKKNN